jgi:hypothetical protein
MFARLAHLQDVYVKEGDKVKKGQKVGTLGTGNGQWSGHVHADFPRRKLLTWTSYVFGMKKEKVKEIFADPKPYRPKWYDHMGWGYLELADYSGKKCYHPGEDWNGKGAGNSDVGLPVEAPFNGKVVYVYSGNGKNGGWGKLVVIEEKLPKSKDLKKEPKELPIDVSSEKIQIINEGTTPVAAQIGGADKMPVVTPEDSSKPDEEIVQTWPAQDKDGNPSRIPETEEEWQKISSDEPSFWFVAMIIILSLLTVFLS